MIKSVLLILAVFLVSGCETRTALYHSGTKKVSYEWTPYANRTTVTVVNNLRACLGVYRESGKDGIFVTNVRAGDSVEITIDKIFLDRYRGDSVSLFGKVYDCHTNEYLGTAVKRIRTGGYRRADQSYPWVLDRFNPVRSPRARSTHARVLFTSPGNW